jgi:hypothetical protein
MVFSGMCDITEILLKVAVNTIKQTNKNKRAVIFIDIPADTY